MAAPKFYETPDTVQTSLYGYDRTKRVQFQINNLRGRPIFVVRRDGEPESAETRPESKSPAGEQPVSSRPARKWIDRSQQFPAPHPNKPMYPSYAHFHHQYTCPKGSFTPPPFATSPHGSSHDRKSPRRATPPNSPKLSPEEELSAKKVFDKLNVSSGALNGAISTEITLLELNPKMAAKKQFLTTCPSIFLAESSEEESEPEPEPEEPEEEPENAPEVTVLTPEPPSPTPDFLLDTPRSLSYITNSATSGDECEISGGEQQLSQELREQLEQPELHEIQLPKGHFCSDEAHCEIFHGGHCPNDEEERKTMLRWYDALLQWRHDIVTKRRFGPPGCHPPPLSVTMLGASRAQRANPFQRVRDVHPFQMEAMEHARRRMEHRRGHRLIPVELPLPPPHEFMANAKCMEPHLFVEYCYQLTAAAYIDSGLNPPHRRPPIPPRVEPIPEQFCRESICSSASEISSDGEYSDDSDGTKEERFRLKMERHTRRERRLQQMFRRRRILDEIDEEDDD